MTKFGMFDVGKTPPLRSNLGTGGGGAGVSRHKSLIAV